MDATGPIVFINNFPGASIGGGERHLLSLARDLVAHGEDVIVVAAADSHMLDRVEAIEGVGALSVDFREGSPTAVALRIARSIPVASIVVGTGFYTNIIARQFGVAVRSRIVNIAHVVPGANRLQGERLLSRIVRWSLDRSSRRSVDRWIAVSDAAAQGLIRDGVRRDRVTVIPNGIDAEEVRSDAGSPEPHEGVRIGFVGRLETVKVPQAMIELANRLPEADLVIAGSGSLAEDLADRSRQAGVADRIDFAGFVDPIEPLLASLDILVVPSLSESSPIVILEAQALGVPVIATNVGGIPEMVIDGVTGLLVPAQDPDALEAAVRRLLSEPELRDRIVDDARRRVELESTLERMVMRYREVFDDLR